MDDDFFNLNTHEFRTTFVLEKLENDFSDLLKITDKWGYLRQIYMEMLPWIIERSKQDINSMINPYPIDWSRYFSPIEESAWASIRFHYVALYPQFPLFNYFVDFANPYLRIGLELDGKDYHDPKKDKVRDEMLWRYGWRIFRVPGSECFTKFKHQDELAEEYMEEPNHEDRKLETLNWMLNSSDGVVKAIKLVYFQQAKDSYLYMDALTSLDKHRLVNFPIERDRKEFY